MAVLIRAACDPSQIEGAQFNASDFSSDVDAGEVFQNQETVYFAFGKAVPGDVVAGDLTNSPDHTIATFEDIFFGVSKCPLATVTGASAVVGGISFAVGDDVFIDLTSATLATSKETDNAYIGKAVTAKAATASTFIINFDGTNPSRSAS